jgi:hypothetical protein
MNRKKNLSVAVYIIEQVKYGNNKSITMIYCSLNKMEEVTTQATSSRSFFSHPNSISELFLHPALLKI